MKALLLTDKKKLELSECEIPKINDDEVLIKVKYTGICGSDIHTYHGQNPNIRYPRIMGHETSGEIVEIGHGSTSNIQVGDRVTVFPLHACGQCILCKKGSEHLCRNRTFAGMTKDGAFAEYVKVHHSLVYKIEDQTPFDVAAMIEPYAVGVHAINRSNLTMGDKVVILGGGPIGLMIALAAKQAGAGLIAISEVSDYRLKKIRELGFIAIDGRETDLKEEVLNLTEGIGADIVFEAAGVPITSEQMTKVLRPEGTAVIAGLYSQFPRVDSNDVNFRELTIKGTTVYTREEFKYAIQSLPIEQLKALISHRLRIEHAAEGFQLSESASESMKILVSL
ncbi:zinc-dependent alcohol dehydrogenase [Bacillus sp. Marseille-P3661]|uniref:zinc-dependent alcohol dehydrogenase n=1 Tax=Bacillus sp. Marseille-P3661 TaxID=1936234 RepID=UPI000C8285E5|nr:alcohol dehydrogenase catalytic domain-containing protein [Bacillus sp. Marseille-P3661]